MMHKLKHSLQRIALLLNLEYEYMLNSLFSSIVLRFEAELDALDSELEISGTEKQAKTAPRKKRG